MRMPVSRCPKTLWPILALAVSVRQIVGSPHLVLLLAALRECCLSSGKRGGLDKRCRDVGALPFTNEHEVPAVIFQIRRVCWHVLLGVFDVLSHGVRNRVRYRA